MAALTKDRNTPQRLGEVHNHPVAASSVIFAGSIVVLDSSGNAEAGSTATGLKAVGRADQHVDNGAGSAGDKAIDVRKGTFLFANDGSIDRTDIEATAYIVDDQTVANTDDTGSRSAAGKIVDVDVDGVWVKFD
ncbi:hypothetical protein [Methylophaga thiooxydans]|uniref:Bacteriophage protein n=1 Tax=Methylophaga thiooxydans DMS010 TaxID=637616 RepID=C0N2G5_9GAMM|nr:hypothetical protein [Methylophaga thiooxydans]EEF78440.1 hypothetical protein MDMS009_2984 [Methylophaga thiooxydans DMS010]EEF78868.1 hypothetical protein MDMS009_2612 [Methylophaga thiooxydans DMS010]EEF79090.1 hypothetical protein MDMS009_2350 [Methylophaga thiooxydans DMS010]EEF80128.1 hypothetical protein MDMS009_1285 [Methylophaga thiooxydans DMS010]EEF80196.1 hypothetical protein MDMS009_1092 [Methylophaga thiooxydans DMS010]